MRAPLGDYKGWKNLGGVAAHSGRPPNNWQSNNAVDFGAPPGTVVVSPVKGVISKQHGFGDFQWVRGSTVWGKRLTIVADRDEGVSLIYVAHLGSYAAGIEPGHRVRAGQPIGKIGNPAYPNGPGFPPHLHIALFPESVSADRLLEIQSDESDYRYPEFELRKVGVSACKGSPVPGRWQVVKEKSRVVFQGPYKAAQSVKAAKERFWRRKGPEL